MAKSKSKAKSSTKAKKKIKTRAKIRIFFAFCIFLSVVTILSYNLFANIQSIMQMNKEKKELEERIVALKKEEETLKSDVQKLEDPAYIARYAREKYLYSKDGELIIRMDD